MKKANYFFALFYMYMVIFFVVSVVQNIFMAVVEDSYISIKYAKNFEWLNTAENNPE